MNMPEWLKDAIIYEIYPQSFLDTNADGIGDFQGIINKLDYIKALGCNTIWIHPCYDSPFRDAGYDVADYYRVAPRYGTNEDLKRVFTEAHEKDMHVLLDLVPGHTALTHPWFQESCKADRNQYTDRYVWTDNPWDDVEGMRALYGIAEREAAVLVNFFSHQPALNYGFYKKTAEWQQSPDDPGPTATVEEMKNVMRFWLGMGCDGFRVDMAGLLVKNDEDGKGNIALWKKFRTFLDEEFPKAAILSEWSQPDKSILGGFHMDFLLNYELFREKEPFFSARGRGDALKFVKQYTRCYEKTKEKGLICVPSGNHDTPRLAGRFSEEELKIVFAFTLSMPGAPIIYYGEEIGMRYVEGLKSVEGGYNRTGSRTPMQWDESTNAGFSAAPKESLYIRQDEAVDRPTVAAQMADPNSLYYEVQKLLAIRKTHKALSNEGEIEFVFAKKNEYPLAYVRSSGEEKILVIINPADREVVFETELAVGIESADAIYFHGKQAEFCGKEVRVPAKSAGFYVISGSCKTA